MDLTSDHFAPGRWRSQWIWARAEPPAGQTHRTVAFRKSFAIDTIPEAVPTRICVDSRYALWVNGAEVARGPVRVNPHRRRYDIVDLAPHLVPGPNVLAVLARFYSSPTAWWMPAPTLVSRVRAGGLVLEADLSQDEWLVSDESWKAQLLEGWREGALSGGVGGRGIDIVDLRSLPHGWESVGFDDAAWESAQAMSGMGMGEPGNTSPPNYPHGPYAPRAIAFATPIRKMLTGEGIYTTSEVVAGTALVDLEGPAGAEVQVRCTEFIGGDAASDSGSPIGFTIVLDGTRREIETFDIYGFREITVDGPDGVIVHGVGVNERLYPVAGDAAFVCSDPRLEQIWQVGRRTVSLCSFDAYIDCPTREQRAWTGDSVVHQMVDLTTNADWRLARWHPNLAAEPNADGMLPMAVAGDAEMGDIAVIPDWALHWVHSVANLWQYVGDAEEIRKLLPVVEGVLRWFDPFMTPEGLLNDVVGWVIIDWSSVYTNGVCTALNGLYARSLLEFAGMAGWLGDEGRAGWARGVHAKMAVAFERLWDDERGRYVDNAKGPVLGRTASQHGQAVAIVGGLAPRQRWPRLIDVMIDEAALVYATFAVPDGEAGPNLEHPPGGGYLRTGHPEPWWDVDRQVVRAQPFFRYVIHDALAEAGRNDLIASQCLDWTQALERCPTSWTETWFGGTVSHGWSSTPTRDLVVRVLGVRPDEPGFRVARLDPALGSLEWAAGRVPCPGGLIDIRVDGEWIDVTSPIPVRYGDQHLDAGTHRLARTS